MLLQPSPATGGADPSGSDASGMSGASPQPQVASSLRLSIGNKTFDLTDGGLEVHGLSAGQSRPKRKRSCFGGVGSSSSDLSAPRTILYYYILWAELSDDKGKVEIQYADHTTKSRLHVESISADLPLENRAASQLSHIRQWLETLLDRAYTSSAGTAQRRKRAYVLINPHAGPGGAVNTFQHRVKPIFDAARMPLTIITTTSAGHATQLCREVDIDAYDIVVPCSGDGLAFEVFNGFGKRPDARLALGRLAVCLVPCGSGNAMSCNFYGTHKPSLAALAIVKGVPTPMDLVSVTQDGEDRVLSFLSQAVGMVADLDITTENLRWMGQDRFTYGFLKLVLQRKIYPCDIAVKVEIENREDIKRHYRERVAASGTGSVGAEEAFTDGNNNANSVGNRDGSESQSTGAAPAEDEHGLPPLRYGTTSDKVPDDWVVQSHDKLGTFYCGNMAYMAADANFFPAASPNDGLMDMITVPGDISPLKSIQTQLSVESGDFFDSPVIQYSKVLAYRLTPRDWETKLASGTGYISIDGERVPFKPFQAEIHRGLGLVLSKSGKYEAPGPKHSSPA